VERAPVFVLVTRAQLPASAGSIAGPLTWASVYPVDVIKTHIQTLPEKAVPREKSFLFAVSDLAGADAGAGGGAGGAGGQLGGRVGRYSTRWVTGPPLAMMAVTLYAMLQGGGGGGERGVLARASSLVYGLCACGWCCCRGRLARCSVNAVHGTLRGASACAPSGPFSSTCSFSPFTNGFLDAYPFDGRLQQLPLWSGVSILEST
jgi:hypothetical protein